MKLTNNLFIVFLFTFYACITVTETKGQKITFGIHEIVQYNELQMPVIDTLKSRNIRIEDNPEEYVIGYITKDESATFSLDLSDQNVSIVQTNYLVDKEQRYYAIAAIKNESVINNSHIKKTEVKGTNVILYFNLEGATRWANLTRLNIGRRLAFVIDNRIYSMPIVNAEIRSGMAIINGLSNETAAKEIAEGMGVK